MSDTAISSLPQYDTREIRAPGNESIGFATAGNVRHRARLSGMNPNYWYPAEWASRLKPGEHVETSFWSAPIALFRTEAGELGAIENRCPHRHLPLTMGKVTGCNLVCAYHGWAFGRDGRLQSVHHDQFGRALPRVGVRTYPVRERYGLIWIFPGDPALAEQVPLPVIANAEGQDRWARIEFDFTWKSHHSMVIDNLCNLTHLYVHGDLVPFDKTWMTHSRLYGETLEMVWKHTFRPSIASPLFNLFLDRSRVDGASQTRSIYKYPYHASDQGGARAINLMLPLSADATRVFTLYYWRTIGVPLMSDGWRLAMMERMVVPLFRPGTVEIYRQDGATVEAEMERLDRNFFAPTPELNPVVHLFDRLNSERWQAWLDYRQGEREEAVHSGQPKLLDGRIADGGNDEGKRSAPLRTKPAWTQSAL